MHSRKIHVETADGNRATMTLRELCGWARNNGARVVQHDGWPVVNGRVRSLGVAATESGVVVAQYATIATWQAVESTPREVAFRALQESCQRERDKIARQKSERERLVRSWSARAAAIQRSSWNNVQLGSWKRARVIMVRSGSGSAGFRATEIRLNKSGAKNNLADFETEW